MSSPSSRLTDSLVKVRVDLPLAFLDVLLVSGAYFLALILRFDALVPDLYWGRFLRFLPIAVVVHLAANGVSGLYGEIWRHASVVEARRVILSGLLSGIALFTFLVAGLVFRVPLAVVGIGVAVATMLTGIIRFQSRLFAFHRRPEGHPCLRVAVLGAGEAGAVMIREMLRVRSARLLPVAVFDDDPRQRGRSMMGVPVVGPIDSLPAHAARLDLGQALLAIPSAESDLVRRAADVADRAALPLKVLPQVQDLVGGEPSVADVRDLQVDDLLGREQVATDLDAVAALLADRVVLVTGGGGSIGSEIARQVLSFGPRRLVLVDHDETHLHDTAQAIGGEVVTVLADVRDRDRLRFLVADIAPDVVFHAAAHKHVPLLEDHPGEAVRTNVVGTQNVVDAAAAAGVERLVFISTDKAVNAHGVMGASKWIGEQLVLAGAGPDRHFCCVRFGNVLGSRGSVIPTFARQIAAGGPVTVTDPAMTRYFMSVHEAVQLVLQAAVFAERDDVFMLDMGEPVSIVELASRMIRLTGRSVGSDIAIEFVGLRPGERLTEQLRTDAEVPQPTAHPAIVRLEPPKLAPRALLEVCDRALGLTLRGDGHAAGRLLLDVAGGIDPVAALARVGPAPVLDLTVEPAS